MVQSKPYGISFFKYRTVLSYGRRRPHRTVYGWQPYGTCIWNTVRYFNSDVENLHRYTVRDSYLNRTGSLLVNRTVLGFQIPYGTWEIYIAKYRTGLSFEPYGITFIRPLRTTLHLAPVRDINLHRTVCSFSGFLIMFLSISRPYYNTKSSWPSSTWHWSLFAFRRTSPHWLFPHQYTHTVRDFQPILWNRTVFLFLFFAYRTGCKNLKNQKSPQRTNLIPSRKKF